jgi:hypothetical protein
MVYFQTKKSKLGYILEGLECNICIAIFGIFYVFYEHVEYFTAIRYNYISFLILVYLNQEKSGNPDYDSTLLEPFHRHGPTYTTYIDM